MVGDIKKRYLSRIGTLVKTQSQPTGHKKRWPVVLAAPVAMIYPLHWRRDLVKVVGGMAQPWCGHQR
jgi:hypothetical protein